jgi:CheY-like chemotaxis protein/HPt (histidine-containing phosphotransfer) domain-containing protein
MATMDENEIVSTIHLGLKQLNTTFERNPGKTKEIIDQFIEETPALLTSLREKLSEQRWNEAAIIAHKVKSRYGYFGFDEITTELSAWEETFRDNKSIATAIVELDRIDKITLKMISELRKNTSTGSTMVAPPDGTLRHNQKCVLIAEDDDINAMVMELFITELGVQAIRANDGFEAISKTIEKKPDLILMDVHMPYCSGLDAIKGIRSKGIKTTIVSLSASSHLNERDESLQAGGNDFLMKPANRQSIEQMLIKYLGKLND